MKGANKNQNSDVKSSVYNGWVTASKNFSPGKLQEQEQAQFERAKFHEEQSKLFNFVLGGKVNFNF